MPATDVILRPDWPNLSEAIARSGELVDDQRPLNAQQLVARCMGNLDFAARVIRKFASRFEEDVCELTTSLDQADAPAVARIAHRLKGTAANAAVDQIQQIAHTMEALARDNKLGEVRPLVEQLNLAWDRFVEYMNPEATRPSAPPQALGN